MLFDNDDVIDLNFLSLSNIISDKDVDILSVKEGFLRGNMFKDEYEPYKNLTFLDITPKSDREAKLLNVMSYSFAINDLNLYLDLHPQDKKVLKLLEKLIMEEKNAKEKYISLYGPLDVCDTKGDKFKWIDSPWPWDNERGNIYV